MKEKIYLNALKNHGTEILVLFLPFPAHFPCITGCFPGEPTAEIPTSGNYYIFLVCLMERTNEHTNVDECMLLITEEQ